MIARANRRALRLRRWHRDGGKPARRWPLTRYGWFLVACLFGGALVGLAIGLGTVAP